MRLAKFCLLSLMLLLTCKSLFAQINHLYPIVADTSGNYGYVDKLGNLLIEARYSEAKTFSQGFAPVALGGEWFFIDEQGNKVFAKNFDDAGEFSEGLAPVCRDGLWGYIDLKGQQKIDFQFKAAYGFSEGLACVMQGDIEKKTALYGYINHAGKFVIEPFLKYYDNQFFSRPGKFSEGLAHGWLPGADGRERIGFFNTEGKVTIVPQFFEAGDFNGGLAPVSLSGDLDARSGYIDKDGEFVIKPTFTRAFQFSEGLAAAAASKPDGIDDKFGYIDFRGEFIIEPAFELAEPFYNGIARVMIGDYDNIAYIDKAGNLIVDSNFLSGKTTRQAKNIARLAKLKASTYLAGLPGKDWTYKPENLVDNDFTSAWVEGATGDGVGEWLEFFFTRKYAFKNIIIWSGYQKTSPSGKNLFYSNLRPRQIKLLSENSQEQIIELKDSEEPQTFALNLTGNRLYLEILSVYRNGNEASDCAISEIKISGREN